MSSFTLLISTLIALYVCAGPLSNAVALTSLGEQKKLDKVDGVAVALKAMRNGEIKREDGQKSAVEPDRVSVDQLKQKLTTGQCDVTRDLRQTDALSAVCRVTSSGLNESPESFKPTSDVRRPAKPAAKKRPVDPAGVALSDHGEADVKSRGGGGIGGGVEEFRCRLCNYSGRSQHCLSKHLRAHDLAYKICRYCRRAFERPSDLLRHEERHRRRDVLGSTTTGGVDPMADTVATCSASDVVRQPSVGRVDSYADGVVASSLLVSAQLGPGDNDVILCFDEPAAEALVDQPATPPPSKLRDVYSIMAGIFVNQHLLSFGQSAPVAAGSDQVASRSAVDDRAGSLLPDFGQQAFLQMLDLKMVSESTTSSGGTPGHLTPRGPGTAVAAVSGACRERRRKGVPNRAIHHDASDPTVPVVTFSSQHDSSSDLPDAAKLCVGADMDESSPTFTACNGVVAGGKVAKLGSESDGLLTDYSDRFRLSSRDRFPCRRRSRKFFSISCKICGKRLVQVSYMKARVFI